METFTVELEGGAPWGFSIQGGLDHRSPLRVGKVTTGGRASNAGLVVGDYILRINGEDCKPLKHLQAQQLIKKSVNTVTLMCTKVRPGITSPALSQSFTFSAKDKDVALQPSSGIKALAVPKPRPQEATAAPSSPSISVKDLDVQSRSLDIVDHNQSKSQGNGYGHALDTAHGDCGDGHQQSRLDVSTEVPIKEEPVVQLELSEMPSAYDLSTTDSVVEKPVSQMRRSDEPLVYDFDYAPAPPKTSTEEIQRLDCDAKQPEIDQPSDNEPVKESMSCLDQATLQPLMYTFGAHSSTTTQDTSMGESSEPDVKLEPCGVVRQNEKETVVAVNKDPGWYKQMFQQLHNTLEEDFTDEPLYDSRGLRVRTGSFSNTEQAIKEESRSTHDLLEEASSYPSGVTQEAVLDQSKRTTSYRTESFNTESSRDYWKEKDKDHQEWDKKRKLSQEYTTPVHQDSGEVYKHSVAHMHPLLRDESTERSNEHDGAAVDQTKLLDRIDASKLQKALNTAAVMGQLEQEGVPPHLLPAVIQAQKEVAVSTPTRHTEKPPPGQKAKALFDFCAHGPKEMSFKKGEILDLYHTVDDNWLEAGLGSSRGIIPQKYVQILTLEKYHEEKFPTPPTPTQVARALFDFQGRSERELTFKKGDELHIERRIDANWYEGVCGDSRGIFPIAYVHAL